MLAFFTSRRRVGEVPDLVSIVVRSRGDEPPTPRSVLPVGWSDDARAPADGPGRGAMRAPGVDLAPVPPGVTGGSTSNGAAGSLGARDQDR